MAPRTAPPPPKPFVPMAGSLATEEQLLRQIIGGPVTAGRSPIQFAEGATMQFPTGPTSATTAGNPLARNAAQFASSQRAPLELVERTASRTIPTGPMSAMGSAPKASGPFAFGMPKALGPGTTASLADDVIAQAARTIPGVGAAAAGLGGAAGAGVGATEAAAATGAKGLAGRLGLGGGLKGLTSGLAGPTGLKSGLARGATGLGISLAGNYLGEALGGNDSIAGRFASGAGAGGGLGVMLGPKGALLGGLIGGLGNVLLGGGDDGPDADSILTNALGYSGLPPESQSRITAIYKVMSELGSPEDALDLVGNMMLEEMQATQTHAQDLETMLASQAMTAEFFQPYTQQLLDSANLRANVTTQLADQLPGPYKAVALNEAAAGLSSVQRLASAYSQQAQMIPVMHLAELNRQRSFQQPAAGGGDLTSLLAQAGIGG